jgi:hypothetical protein
MFLESESGDRTEPLLMLNINGVRKASNRAPLGYIHPSYLRRGLSVKSLIPGIDCCGFIVNHAKFSFQVADRYMEFPL